MTQPDERAHLTPRQVFTLIAALLALALIGLLIYLFMFFGSSGLVESGGKDQGDLRPLFTIYGPGIGDMPKFSRPMGVASGLDDRIYVSDTENNRIVVFDSNGGLLFEFGGFGVAKPISGSGVPWEEGQLNFPLGIDTDEAGNVYVADFRNDQIQVFNPEGLFLRRFPDPREKVGQGSSGQGGTGIAVTDVAVHDGKVYATDTYQLIVFTVEGEFVTQIGRPGTGSGDLDHPNGIAVAEDGTIYVSDSNNNRVVAIDDQGDPLWVLGEPVNDIAAEEGEESEFGLPRGLTVLDDGTLLVVDSFGFNLIRVSADGKVIDSYGDRGVEPGQFNFPNGVDNVGKKVLVADKENDRIQVLELLK